MKFCYFYTKLRVNYEPITSQLRENNETILDFTPDSYLITPFPHPYFLPFTYYLLTFIS